MIPTVSAISVLLAAAVTSPERTSSPTTANTRMSPKTCSVADAMNVPSTARMIRKRLVPRMRRITVRPMVADPADPADPARRGPRPVRPARHAGP